MDLKRKASGLGGSDDDEPSAKKLTTSQLTTAKEFTTPQPTTTNDAESPQPTTAKLTEISQPDTPKDPESPSTEDKEKTDSKRETFKKSWPTIGYDGWQLVQLTWSYGSVTEKWEHDVDK